MSQVFIYFLAPVLIFLSHRTKHTQNPAHSLQKRGIISWTRFRSYSSSAEDKDGPGVMSAHLCAVQRVAIDPKTVNGQFQKNKNNNYTYYTRRNKTEYGLTAWSSQTFSEEDKYGKFTN